LRDALRKNPTQDFEAQGRYQVLNASLNAIKLVVARR
jgi:hypothetical protein